MGILRGRTRRHASAYSDPTDADARHANTSTTDATANTTTDTTTDVANATTDVSSANTTTDTTANATTDTTANTTTDSTTDTTANTHADGSTNARTNSTADARSDDNANAISISAADARSDVDARLPDAISGGGTVQRVVRQSATHKLVHEVQLEEGLCGMRTMQCIFYTTDRVPDATTVPRVVRKGDAPRLAHEVQMEDGLRGMRRVLGTARMRRRQCKELYHSTAMCKLCGDSALRAEQRDAKGSGVQGARLGWRPMRLHCCMHGEFLKCE